jgi:hypothetical protein
VVTKKAIVWMLEDDVRAFGQQVRLALPVAWWMCSHPGPRGLHQVHAHASLEEALDCGGRIQASLPLPAGPEVPEGALVGAGVTPQPGVPVSALVRFVQTVQQPVGLFGSAHLQAGGLTVRYEQGLFELAEQVEQVWSALEKVTSSGLVAEADGTEHTGFRIGPAARALVTETGLALSLGGSERLALVR